jgi:serine/threonine-protein kinase
VKVVDFGLAKRLDGAAAKVVTGPFENMGSPCCMSPEDPEPARARRAHGHLVARRGAVSAADHGAPFNGDSVAEVCAGCSTPRRCSSPSTVGARPGIEAIVARCLEKKPEDRYQSIGDSSKRCAATKRRRSPPPSRASMTRSSLRSSLRRSALRPGGAEGRAGRRSAAKSPVFTRSVPAASSSRCCSVRSALLAYGGLQVAEGTAFDHAC